MVGNIEEVHVEGRNHALGQWIGKTSQHRTLNFSHDSEESLLGKYLQVRVTRAGPNSLVGQSVAQSVV
jgi:tRNA-2-methylthio-N6-dimethylallyladenosine synthase